MLIPLTSLSWSAFLMCCAMNSTPSRALLTWFSPLNESLSLLVLPPGDLCLNKPFLSQWMSWWWWWWWWWGSGGRAPWGGPMWGWWAWPPLAWGMWGGMAGGGVWMCGWWWQWEVHSSFREEVSSKSENIWTKVNLQGLRELVLGSCNDALNSRSILLNSSSNENFCNTFFVSLDHGNLRFFALYAHRDSRL